MTSKCDLVYASLIPLRDKRTLGQRTFHERVYEVVEQTEVGPSVLADLKAEGVKLFVRSPPLEFDSAYWALYELFVPIAPKSDTPEDQEMIEFTQHFFGIFYRELKK